jgi:hypothetical protein
MARGAPTMCGWDEWQNANSRVLFTQAGSRSKVLRGSWVGLSIGFRGRDDRNKWPR